MKIRLALSVIAAVLTVSCGAPAQEAQNDRKADPVTMFAESDRQMNAAMAEARRTMPRFWAAIDSDPAVAGSALIKLGFDTDDGSVEHIWVEQIRRDGDVIRGVVGNRPVHIASLSKGDAVTIDPKRISDWSYTRGERMYGNFTTRVMLPELPAEHQAELRAALSEKPLEDGRP